jgi:predicted ATPase
MEVMRQGLNVSREIGTALNRPYSLALLAEMHGAVGEEAEGLMLLHEARQSVQKIGGHFYQAEIYRLTGELTLQQGREQSAKGKVTSTQQPTRHTPPEAEAERYFQKALEIARHQGAKLFELRASVSLSRLWQWQGKAAQAGQLLATLYNWFTEGLDAVDLQEAKTLLEQLR